MATDLQLFVADQADGRGYAYLRPDGELACLAATDESTATNLLWRYLAHVHELGKPAGIIDLNAQQQWAIGIAFAARLKVAPAGPVFWRGFAPPPAYLPSGAYL
jgi:hypothetical protein